MGDPNSRLSVTPEDDGVWTNTGLVTDEDIVIETEVKTSYLFVWVSVGPFYLSRGNELNVIHCSTFPIKPIQLISFCSTFKSPMTSQLWASH